MPNHNEMNDQQIRGQLNGRRVLVVTSDPRVKHRIKGAFRQYKVHLTFERCIIDGLDKLRETLDNSILNKNILIMLKKLVLIVLKQIFQRSFEYDLIVTYVALPETNGYYSSGRQNSFGICKNGGIVMVRKWCEWCRNSGDTNQIPVLYLATLEAEEFKPGVVLAPDANNAEWLYLPVQPDLLIQAAARHISQALLGGDWLKDMKNGQQNDYVRLSV